ncbi:MAG: AAA family ATPase [Planctomycetota bacterium]|nr:AAA family ATPase [Planctomycetota bacterium]
MAKRATSKRVDAPSQDAPSTAAGMGPAREAGVVALDHVLGQSGAIAHLQAAIRAGRLHHAWLFHGPEGVGKFTAAMAFAAVILDPSSAPGLDGTIRPDPDSQVQQLIRRGAHPDLHVINKALAEFSNDKRIRDARHVTIAKDVIDQRLIKPASLAPMIQTSALAAKVFIIDEAELLDRSTTHAPTQNALLKTLEEPSERTVIILVTSSEDRLLATIRSRCTRVAFLPLDEASMRAWMARADVVGGSDGGFAGSSGGSGGIAPEQLPWLLEYAQGSPGRLLGAIRDELPKWGALLAPMVDAASKGSLPISMGATMAGMCEAWAKAQVDAADHASKESANRVAADLLFRVLGTQLRTMLRAAAGAGEHDRCERIASAIDAVRQCETYIDSNVQASFSMDWLAGELASAFAGTRFARA